jgi:hypothetical protein
MGYKDFNKNIKVLRKCKGIMENAVTLLLSGGY